MQLRLFLLIFLSLVTLKNSAQSTVSQHVDTFVMYAPQLNTEKKIWIYLPKDYPISEKAYSVIYMHDAQNLFDAKSSYVGEWEVDEYLDSLSENKAIVIGIEHGNDMRLEELTPYSNEKYGGGKGDAYLDFIINTLKPHVDSTFRTLSDAKHTTIFGSSLGGLLSFHAIIKHPEIFGNAGIFSPSFWINPEIYSLVEASNIPESSRFYFAVGSDEGDKDMVPDEKKMVALLKSKGVSEDQIVSKIVEGGKHSETFWSDYFPEAYHWLIEN